MPAGAPRTAMADLEEAGVPSGPLSSEGDAVPASSNQENADPSDERSLRKMFQQGTEEIATHRCPQLWGWAKGVPSIPGASGMAHLSAGEVVEQSAGGRTVSRVPQRQAAPPPPPLPPQLSCLLCGRLAWPSSTCSHLQD